MLQEYIKYFWKNGYKLYLEIIGETMNNDYDNDPSLVERDNLDLWRIKDIFILFDGKEHIYPSYLFGVLENRHYFYYYNYIVIDESGHRMNEFVFKTYDSMDKMKKEKMYKVLDYINREGYHNHEEWSSMNK